MTVYFSDLKDYGQEVDLEIILNKYRMYFEEKFTTEHIIYAIHEHCKKSIEIPRIVNIDKILNPEPIKITESEFIAACQWQGANKDYSEFTSAAYTIRDYQAQRDGKREQYKIENKKILEIAQNSIKRIEG